LATPRGRPIRRQAARGRPVYATMMKEWTGFDETKSVLQGSHPTLGVFA
jgi:hypothetical protein